jgi:hypothetical protein
VSYIHPIDVTLNWSCASKKPLPTSIPPSPMAFALFATAEFDNHIVTFPKKKEKMLEPLKIIFPYITGLNFLAI